MIINSAKAIRTKDVPTYAWSRIAQFQNTEHTADEITKLHRLGKKQLPNARRQAEQIKYCLSQAKEYYDAAMAVSLATRPVLLYYSVMSIALSEVLFKQTGESRLALLRQHHNCHGLQLVVKADPRTTDVLRDAASALLAKVQMDPSRQPKGTFEVWRRSAREYPVGGEKSVIFPNGAKQSGYALLLAAVDKPPPVLPNGGVTLFECLSQLPYLEDVLARLGAKLNMVRATLHTEQKGQAGTVVMSIILHPADQELLDKFGNLVVAEPSAVNSLDIRELPSGYIIYQQLDPRLGQIISWPHSTCLTDKDVYFSCSNLNLGEFGFLYVALHICGNYARYYPDLWLKHIEKHSPLAMIVDELCVHALDRLPLLCLSELLRCYYVVEE